MFEDSRRSLSRRVRCSDRNSTVSGTWPSDDHQVQWFSGTFERKRLTELRIIERTHRCTNESEFRCHQERILCRMTGLKMNVLNRTGAILLCGPPHHGGEG